MTADPRFRVEILRDNCGPYGIGVGDGVETLPQKARPIILRPDRFVGREFGSSPAYQQIVIGGPFKRTAEGGLREIIHWGMLERASLNLQDRTEQPWWSNDKAKQDENRRKFHGLKLCSVKVINRLIREALSVAAPEDAVQVARRYRLCYRQSIYEAVACSHRALQLAETFPVLALAIYSEEHSRANMEEGAEMVRAGAPLNHIASVMKVPMALRKIKPGAADVGLGLVKIFSDTPNLIHSFMPDTTPAMKVWLLAVHHASQLGGPFVGWTAKNSMRFGRAKDEVLAPLYNISDWVKASYAASVPEHVLRALQAPGNTDVGGQFVTRPFSPNMSLRTVARLSDEWHEAVANNMGETGGGTRPAFPPPWIKGAKINGYEIVPIESAADLYLEGKKMHHCVGTYAWRVASGEAFLYSVRENEQRVATIMLVAEDGKPKIGGASGPYNARLPKKTITAVHRWLRGQRIIQPPKPKERDDIIPLGPDTAEYQAAGGDLDDEIPF